MLGSGCGNGSLFRNYVGPNVFATTTNTTNSSSHRYYVHCRWIRMGFMSLWEVEVRLQKGNSAGRCFIIILIEELRIFSPPFFKYCRLLKESLPDCLPQINENESFLSNGHEFGGFGPMVKGAKDLQWNQGSCNCLVESVEWTLDKRLKHWRIAHCTSLSD